MRDDVIDISKGVGIFFVVWGHTVCPIDKFIYEFHVPFFFIVSGYFYSRDESWFRFLKKNIKRIVYPYLIYSVIAYVFYSLWMASIFGIKSVDFFSIINVIGYKEPVIAPLWFLLSLFEVVMLYDLLVRFFERKYTVLFVSLVLCFVSYLNSSVRNALPFNYFHVMSSLSMLFFYAFGAYFRKRSLSLYLEDKVKVVILLLSCLSLLLYLSRYSEGLDINGNYITAPFPVYLINALSGSWLIITISVFFLKIKSINKIFSYIGRNSLFYFALHFPVFELSRPIAAIVLEKNTYIWGLLNAIICLVLLFVLLMLFREFGKGRKNANILRLC